MNKHLAWHGLALLTYAVLAGAFYLGHQLYQQAPKQLFTLEKVDITLQPGEDIILGRKAFLQRIAAGAAERSHLKLLRNTEGRWFMANVANHKRVDVRTGQIPSRFLKRWRLSAGDWIEISGNIIEVIRADSANRQLILKNDQQKLSWVRGVLQIDGTDQKALRACGRNPGAWWWRQLGSRGEIKLFSLGGLKNCRDRWAVSGAPLKTARIYWHDGAFWLGPGSAEQPVYFSRGNHQTWLTFSEIGLPLQGKQDQVERIIVGRTHFRLKVADDTLTLIPVSGQDFYYRQDIVKEPCRIDLQQLRCRNSLASLEQDIRRVPWMGHGLQPLAWVHSHQILASFIAAMGIVMLSVMIYLSRRFKEPLRKSLYENVVLVPSVVGLILTVSFYLLPGEPDLVVKLLLLGIAWTWATLVLHWRNRLQTTAGIVWMCGVQLAATGTLTLVQLGVGSLNSRWLSYADKHMMILTVFAWTVVFLNLIPISQWRHWLQGLAGGRQRFWVLLRYAIPLSLLAVLILQALVGNEKGVFGVQPIEAVKFVVILMAAIVGGRLIELRRIGAETYRDNPLYFLFATTATAVMFIAFTVAIMLAVRDFSPFLIVFIFLSALFWRLAVHPEKGQTKWSLGLRTIILLPFLAIIGMGFYIYQVQPQDMAWIPQYDRFRVWADPATYPHTGAQLLGALENVRLGGWHGAGKQWFGENGPVVKVPAIQNDFIGAFLLHRFGGIAGLVLLATQLVFLLLLWYISDKARNQAAGRDYKDREIWQVFNIVVFGVASMYSVHWFISWGNVLGLLPVMGQPMTWISAANSHLLLFALPAFYLAVIIAWLLQEEPSY